MTFKPRPCSIALALGLLATWGCTSRTLPLPPPVIDSVSAPNAQGLTRVRGSAHEGNWVGVINERTMQGAVATSAVAHCDRSCPFEVMLEAESGDHLRIWQFVDTSSLEDRQVP